LKPYSLRLRLLVGGALWIILALVMVGVAIVVTFSAIVYDDQQADLQVSFNRLVAGLTPEATKPVSARALTDARYQAPLGGLYWQIEDLDTDRLYRSRSLWDHRLTLPGPDGFLSLPGPGGQTVNALSRVIVVPVDYGEAKYRITVAEDRGLREAVIAQFRFDLALALTMVGLALVAAAVFQVHFGLRPLAALHDALGNVRAGSAARLPEEFPAEVLPLVAEVNALIDAQEAALTDARGQAADLAHGLKTPMAVLRATAARLRDRGESGEADGIDMLCDEMAERVDYNIALSKLRTGRFVRGAEADLNQAVRRSVSVLRKTERGEGLFWQLDIKEPISVALDPHDLMELVGVLLENAAKWARSRVDVRCFTDRDGARLEIVDDGAGVSEDQLALLGERGRRLDESRPGHGLGLAIARQIVARCGGQLGLERSGDTGGMLVRLRLPRPSAAVA
jgi:signal transduction histidine kinase